MTSPADIPPPLPWKQRAKGVGSMPGGYAGYIGTLREICGFVAKQLPSSLSLTSWIQENFEISGRSAKSKESFLHKAGVLESTTGQINLSEHASRWYVAEDDGMLIALLHSRLQFFGEMLAELRGDPRSAEDLRQATKAYSLNWDSQNQVHRRRGWLESAKLVAPIDSDRLAITDAGRDLLTMLIVHQPGLDQEHSRPQLPPEPAPETASDTTPSTVTSEPDNSTTDRDLSPAEALANEIRDASTDSQNPDRLEFAVRDAFQFLGFDAEKLGGSGKTDVLAKALLGKDDSYSVAIDAKTVGAGSLGDGQVDWVTLDEHKKQHNADYSMLVGPNPSGKRLMNRAVDQSVAVLSTEQLADLCLQHAEAPLSLQDYRSLFAAGGAVDTAPIGRAAQDLARLRELATELLATLADQTSDTGPLTARDLWLLMRNQPSGEASSEQEIQQVLDTLASPLVGAVQGTATAGYIREAAQRVTRQRLHLLGNHVAR